MPYDTEIEAKTDTKQYNKGFFLLLSVSFLFSSKSLEYNLKVFY